MNSKPNAIFKAGLTVALLGALVGAGAAVAQVEEAHLRVDGMT